MTLADSERAYLATQRLGRLATIAPDGAPQNNPVGFQYNSQTGTIDIYGLDMGATRKFRNVQSNAHVALVVDDVVSVDPWQVRGIEIRGDAEALADQDPPSPSMSREVIRIHPRRVISWNIDPSSPARRARDAGAGPGGGLQMA
jgi:pyridoxamine 5'-phosphate oxidase family protein